MIIPGDIQSQEIESDFIQSQNQELILQDSVKISIKDIRITNQIFVEHEFQSKIIDSQSELISIQDTLNSILEDSNKNLLYQLENKDIIINEQNINFKKELKKEKTKNTYTKIALVLSILANGFLLLK